MTYVMSDIHGRDDLFKTMLKKINFDEDKDFLYVLGDVVARGGDMSALFLVKSIVERGCCTLIKGNHELILSNLLDYYKNPNDIVEKINNKMLIDLSKKLSQKKLNPKKLNQKNNAKDLLSALGRVATSVYALSLDYGIYDLIRANITQTNTMREQELGRDIKTLQKLSKAEINELNTFLKNLPTMQEVNINGKKYKLVHGGYNSKNRDDVDFLTTARGEFYLNAVGEPDTIVIFGHTTTMVIKAEKYQKMETPYTIWFDKSGDKIGIDCGAAYPHGQLACLCLDDMTEYYVPNERNMIMPLDYRNQQMITLKKFEQEIHRKYPYDKSAIFNGDDINQLLFD